MPLSGERVWGRRAREALERGGTSPEGATGPRARRGLTRGASSPRARRGLTRGASSPRARRSLTRGGVPPSSEADPHPRGHPVLERGGSLLVQCRAPRAKRSSARGWLGRLSGGPSGPPGSWARPLGRELS
jgi:hypothetical protein